MKIAESIILGIFGSMVMTVCGLVLWVSVLHVRLDSVKAKVYERENKYSTLEQNMNVDYNWGEVQQMKRVDQIMRQITWHMFPKMR